MADQAMKKLALDIKQWGRELGFQEVGISAPVVIGGERRLAAWLDAGFHGDMDYMAIHGPKRARPTELFPATRSVIVARMDYAPPGLADAQATLSTPQRAYISRYALGRDYHKLMRSRLKRLALRIEAHTGPFLSRPFCDSAPLMEAPLARQAGLGWQGKHTLLISRSAGTFFFLGELLCDLPLPPDTPGVDHCGACGKCLEACPTAAIVQLNGRWQVDARRCISWLTIELSGAIPPELRPLLGNRIYGCDDCQLACPWNRFAQSTCEADFAPRGGLEAAQLVDLFAWSAAEFEARLAGSAIYRIGHERWLRNIAVALGNAPTSPEIIQALQARCADPSPLVREHVAWALERHNP
jgi:epoxyqueuosine reductase